MRISEEARDKDVAFRDLTFRDVAFKKNCVNYVDCTSDPRKPFEALSAKHTQSYFGHIIKGNDGVKREIKCGKK